MRDTVGVNLDVAHWSLCGIEPEWVAEQPVVSECVTHAHVSDWWLGHIGDLYLEAIHPLNGDSLLRRWLDFLTHLSHNSPRFSGVVSLEMEAAKHAWMLTDSLDALSQCLEDLSA